MRIIQYIVFLLLVLNGLSPLLDSSSATIEDVCGQELFVSDNQELSSEEQQDGEDSSEDDLAAPNHKVILEHKPHDTDTNPSELPIAESDSDYSISFQLEQIKLSFWDTYPKVDEELKEHMHFSKRPIESYT